MNLAFGAWPAQRYDLEWLRAQAQAVLEGAIERVLGSVLKAMHVPALRSAIEQHLQHLAATFSYEKAIPHLQVSR